MNPIHATLFNLIYLGWKKPSWKGFSKLNKNFLRNYLETFWIFSGFWGGFFFIFLEELFWRIFFGRIFLGGSFWEDFFERIFWEDFSGRIFFGGILCLYWNWLLLSRLWVFVKILSQCRRRKDKKFRSLEVLEASSLHIKIGCSHLVFVID